MQLVFAGAAAIGTLALADASAGSPLAAGAPANLQFAQTPPNLGGGGGLATDDGDDQAQQQAQQAAQQQMQQAQQQAEQQNEQAQQQAQQAEQQGQWVEDHPGP